MTLRAAQAALAGRRRGLGAVWPFLGPAFVAAVAYIDPGNFATNVAAGSKFGYLLLWVVLAANLTAMLVQTLSAKLGIATGRNLAELCREHVRKPVAICLWLQAEVVAMATDLAEVLGAALGLSLLFGTPLLVAGFIASGAAFAILALQRQGFRRLEAVIAGFVGVIVAAFAFEVFFARPQPVEVLRHSIVPGFDGSESVLLAVGILGATVMPHVVYLHSALTQRRVVGRDEREKHAIQRFERIDVFIAMGIAGLVNMAMLAIAAAVLFGQGTDTIEGAYHGLEAEGGRRAALLFGIALLASGLSSTSVGTMAGQVVMQGFIHRQIPLFVRRTVTLIPALAVLAIGVEPTDALILSQVVLSFGIPFAIVPLVTLTGSRRVMGTMVNSGLTTVTAATVAGFVIILNIYLLVTIINGN